MTTTLDRSRLRAGRWTLGAAVLISLAGCHTDKRTEIILGLATDLRAPAPLRTVRLQVFHLPEMVELANQEMAISGRPDQPYELPGSFAIYSESGAADRVRVVLSAKDEAGKTLVTRTAVMSLVPRRTLFVRLGLVTACQVVTDCAPGATCIDGRCASEDIDSTRLPDFKPGVEQEVACAGAAAYRNTSTNEPLQTTGSTCAPIDKCQEGVCLVPPPAPGTTFGEGTEVSTGSVHTCALLDNGVAKCWGENGSGQLGDGTTVDSPTPVVVGGSTGTMTGVMTGAVDISAGYGSTCAVLSDGTVTCWGNNGSGQLGNGTTTNSPTPVVAAAPAAAVDVSVGGNHTCAVLSDGTVRCWGDNGSGQLGNGTTTASTTPVAVAGVNNAASVSASAEHTCVVSNDGTVQCWGQNDAGQLGNGTTTDSSTPVSVMGVADAKTVSTSWNHACAVIRDGTVACWGDNRSGQLGNGSTTPSSTAVAVGGLSNATGVSAGNGYTCAVRVDGTVACWGDNGAGQLGTGSTTNSTTPVEVGALGSTLAVSTLWNHTCALLTDTTIKCWGDNSSGQLGDGTTTSSPTPAPVARGLDVNAGGGTGGMTGAGGGRPPATGGSTFGTGGVGVGGSAGATGTGGRSATGGGGLVGLAGRGGATSAAGGGGQSGGAGMAGTAGQTGTGGRAAVGTGGATVGSGGATSPAGTGGSTFGSGGSSSGAGGRAGFPGSGGSGGRVGTGGAPSTGGTTGSGGATSTGGATGTGGSAVATLDCGPMGWAVENHGPPQNRVNYVILGDGYTSAELGPNGAFEQHIANTMSKRFSDPFGQPYLRYRNFINICAIRIASPGPVCGSSSLGCCGSDTTRLATCDAPSVASAFAALPASLEIDWKAVVLNSSSWWNSGGATMYWAGGNADGPGAALHEGSHGFHQLADEYGNCEQGRITSDLAYGVNASLTNGSSGGKWDGWIGYNHTPGTAMTGFFGCDGGATWRSTSNSVMNSLFGTNPNTSYNPVSREKIIMDIWRAVVQPYDSVEPPAGAVTNPATLTVNVIDPAVISVDWSVDGTLRTANGGPTFAVTSAGLASGTHTITARAYDNAGTDLVRQVPGTTFNRQYWGAGAMGHSEKTVTWMVTIP